jgi:hypothetical protein
MGPCLDWRDVFVGDQSCNLVVRSELIDQGLRSCDVHFVVPQGRVEIMQSHPSVVGVLETAQLYGACKPRSLRHRHVFNRRIGQGRRGDIGGIDRSMVLLMGRSVVVAVVVGGAVVVGSS